MNWCPVLFSINNEINMSKQLLFICMLLILFGCSRSDQYNLDFHTKSIEVQEEPVRLIGKRLGVSDSLYQPMKLAVFSDKNGQLMAVVSDRSKQPPLHYLNLTQDEYLTGMGRSGKGPGEFVNAGSVYYDAKINQAIIVDPMQQRLTFIDPNKPVDSLKNLHQTEPRVLNLEFRGLPFDLLKLQNDRYAAIGPMRVNSSQKFAFIDSSGQQTQHIGTIPDYESINLPPAKQHLSWRAYGTKNRAGTRFAAAYYNMDLFEIFNNDGERIQAVRGPHFSPLIVSSQDGVTQLSKEHTRTGYIAVTAQDGYIYGLYSGRKLDHPQRNMANMLLILDWDGNFITSYKLDRNVFEFAVSPAGKYLFAIVNDEDAAESGLYRYDLPHPK